MSLMPKRVKYRKTQRGKMKGNATRGHTVEFGEFGLQALESHWISARQIEAGRVAAAHFLRGRGKLYIRVFPHKSVTATAAETRMGKGKGEVDFWAACVKPGTILFEISGVSPDDAKEVMNRICHKMPIKCKLAERAHRY